VGTAVLIGAVFTGAEHGADNPNVDEREDQNRPLLVANANRRGDPVAAAPIETVNDVSIALINRMGRLVVLLYVEKLRLTTAQGVFQGGEVLLTNPQKSATMIQVCFTAVMRLDNKKYRSELPYKRF